VFRADCKAKRANWRTRHFFSLWTAHARHNAHALVLQPHTSWVGRRILADYTSRCGLTDALAAKGPFTVFAPTDGAIKRLPSGTYDRLLKDSAKLKAVMNYHVVSGYLMARDMKSGDVMTLQGSTLTAAVSSSDVQVNGVLITQADLVATNGIVHAIDEEILPKNWQLLAAAA